MNIEIFIKSLSEQEIQELKSYFKTDEGEKINSKTTIRKFFYDNNLSCHLINCLHDCNETFVNDIDIDSFKKQRHVGPKTFSEFQNALIENNIILTKELSKK